MKFYMNRSKDTKEKGPGRLWRRRKTVDAGAGWGKKDGGRKQGRRKHNINKQKETERNQSAAVGAGWRMPGRRKEAAAGLAEERKQRA